MRIRNGKYKDLERTWDVSAIFFFGYSYLQDFRVVRPHHMREKLCDSARPIPN